MVSELRKSLLTASLINSLAYRYTSVYMRTWDSGRVDCRWVFSTHFLHRLELITTQACGLAWLHPHQSDWLSNICYNVSEKNRIQLCACKGINSSTNTHIVEWMNSWSDVPNTVCLNLVYNVEAVLLVLLHSPEINLFNLMILFYC